MSVASLRQIGALVREQGDVILSRWRREVRRLPSAQGLDAPTLNDHMPVLIQELADALESQPDNTTEDLLLQGSPPAHGRQRLHDGFNVEEVVAEYNVLRACIHDVTEEQGLVIHGSDLRVVNRIIDEAIGLAVQTYATQLSLEIQRHRDQHLAFVAHDLHTPLQAIAVTVSIIERTLAGAASSDQATKLLTILRRNVQQLEKSVVEVIKASGNSSVDAKLERRTIDLWPLVETVVRGLEPVISASTVELINDVPSDIVVFADAGLLKRVFENLLAYAVNSAPRGTVRVEALEAGRAGVQCRVSHNGAPLPPAELAKIFENGQREPAQEGIGLGLAIVKQSVEAHGGEITAKVNGEGETRFEFRLPAAERST